MFERCRDFEKKKFKIILKSINLNKKLIKNNDLKSKKN